MPKQHAPPRRGTLWKLGLGITVGLLHGEMGSLPAADSETPTTFYREPGSYGTLRDTHPPRYVRSFAEIWDGAYSDQEGLDVGLDFRFRYEYRESDQRRPEPVLVEPLLFRTRAYFGIRERWDPFRFAVELEDARRTNNPYPEDDRDVNAFEPIQAYAELHFADALGWDSLGNPRPFLVRGGRMAFEFLDRRFLANNQWRNTTNTFQGFRSALGQESNDWQVDLLAVQPLQRQLYDLDEVREDEWLYAVIGHWRGWSDVMTLEPYFLSLDQPSRTIHSAALRTYGKWPGTRFDFDVDTVWQFGEDDGDPHRAYGFTGEVGYRFDAPWKPRLSAFYGHASGDLDPTDNRSGRFERYFGFNRPWSASDYIVWENIRSPSIRLQGQPTESLRFDLGYSWYCLASPTDRWNGANLRDITGQSGDSIGQEFDARVQWKVSRTVQATLGYAHFDHGEFPRRAGKPWDSDFAYIEISLNAF